MTIIDPTDMPAGQTSDGINVKVATAHENVLATTRSVAPTRLHWPQVRSGDRSVTSLAPQSAPAGPRKPLKLWPISDLHLMKGEGWPAGQIPEADVAVVAGDVTEGLVEAVGWLGHHIRPHMPVVFVPGNHEYWSTLHGRALEQGRIAASVVGVDLLDGDAVIIEGVRFIGATLWTDYALFGESNREACELQARSGMTDHRRIAWAQEPWARFKPHHAAMLHRQALRDVEQLFRAPHDGPTVVVSHHAPHPLSLAKQDRAQLISAAYALDLSEPIGRWAPDLWLHGHTHHAVDDQVARTRILGNPRGYRSEWPAIGFQPLLVVEV